MIELDGTENKANLGPMPFLVFQWPRAELVALDRQNDTCSISF